MIALLSTISSLTGAALVGLYYRSRMADMRIELERLRAELSTYRPRYRDELPTLPGAYWLRSPDGHESVREVTREESGELRVAYAARLAFFADGYQWAGPLPRPVDAEVRS